MLRDEEIIAGFLSGEREALDAVESWIARAASPYRRRLAAQWEDVLQSARAEITSLLQRGTFRGESSLKTYLWQVVNHTCLNYLRAQAKEPAVDLDDFTRGAESPDDSPLEQVIQKETAQFLLRVLEEMPAECRELWRMILAGLSYREMSQHQGASEAALRVRVLRCRKNAVAARERLLGRAQGVVM